MFHYNDSSLSVASIIEQLENYETQKVILEEDLINIIFDNHKLYVTNQNYECIVFWNKEYWEVDFENATIKYSKEKSYCFRQNVKKIIEFCNEKNIRLARSGLEPVEASRNKEKLRR